MLLQFKQNRPKILLDLNLYYQWPLLATISASAFFITPLTILAEFGQHRPTSAICYRAFLINLFAENEYDSDVYSPLPKHRNASLRERVSSVNSEVTIHDVRRCTITGT